MFSIMPYLIDNRMTDSDVAALVAFLRTVKPVDRAAEAVESVRWRGRSPQTRHVSRAPDAVLALALDPRQELPPPRAPTRCSPAASRCGPRCLARPRCSPRTSRPIPTPGSARWTEVQIVATLTTMTRPDGHSILGPMMFMQTGWSQLEDADLEAVASFVHALPPVKMGRPPGAPPAAEPPKSCIDLNARSGRAHLAHPSGRIVPRAARCNRRQRVDSRCASRLLATGCRSGRG